MQKGSDVPEGKNTCVTKLHSGMSYNAASYEFSINSKPTVILNKVSLNRNTHKTRLCIDQLMKICGWRLLRSYSCISFRNSASMLANPVSDVTL